MKFWSLVVALLLVCPLLRADGEFDVDFADKDFQQYLQGINVMPPELAEMRLNNFAAHLQITDPQMQTWLKFKNQVVGQLAERERRAKALVELKNHASQLTALNLLQLQQRHLEIRLHETKLLNASVIELYNLLDDQQKYIFNRAAQFVWNWHLPTE